jgi:phosphomevalonate kinase
VFLILGIDDCETECDLDDVNDWDLKINNNGNNMQLIIKEILNILN